ncbi:unnamed protein product [Danaus chrysippus]|uniref:(African queen) hypothetical protein n=1 Tax=Danaus chrysippus TaxID=151541 RepID=A0A8J2QCA1_9NEOP|nr:unnamed protein product [Danaus chrysippus]
MVRSSFLTYFIKIMWPQAALDDKHQWQYIVNTGEFPFQGFRLNRCIESIATLNREDKYSKSGKVILKGDAGSYELRWLNLKNEYNVLSFEVIFVEIAPELFPENLKNGIIEKFKKVD